MTRLNKEKKLELRKIKVEQDIAIQKAKDKAKRDREAIKKSKSVVRVVKHTTKPKSKKKKVKGNPHTSKPKYTEKELSKMIVYGIKGKKYKGIPHDKGQILEDEKGFLTIITKKTDFGRLPTTHYFYKEKPKTTSKKKGSK